MGTLRPSGPVRITTSQTADRLHPFALKDTPALIERLLPVQKLSAESYKEQMLVAGEINLRTSPPGKRSYPGLCGPIRSERYVVPPSGG